MKISKSVLVSSMALAGIVLGTVAPTTAQAATSGYDANMQPSKTPVEVGSLNDGASAYASDDTSATAQSDANVQVISGFLSLEQVPDFSFGRTIENSVVDLQSNASAIDGDDGNNGGYLKVTESRNTAEARAEGDTSTAKGFSISAKLGDFTNNKNIVTPDFVLTLNPVVFKNLNPASGISGLQTSSAVLTSGKGEAQTIANVEAKNDKNGQYVAKFNTPKSAQLTVPAKTASTDTKDNGVAKYKSVVTWTLNAKAGSTQNA